ncbi:MAG: hypothetical protein IPQ07_14505 [Myxococcales bacterium]|nr:hypothetical protein [Myxococcales bacterium]
MNTTLIATSVVLATASCAAMIPSATSNGEAGGKQVRLVVSKTELDVTDNKLRFNAWVIGDSYAKGRAALRSPSGTEASFDFEGDCTGVVGGLRTLYRTTNDCGFDLEGDGPGKYLLTVSVAGAQPAQLEFQLHAVALRPGAKQSLVLDERGYAGTLHHNGMSMMYRHPMSPTDPVSQLQFVWFRGDTMVGVEQAVAKGPELQYRPLPSTTVGVITGGVPREPAETTEHIVLVFRDGRELLGTFRVPGGVYFHVDLLPTQAPPKELVTAARLKALARHLDGIKPQFLERTYPEPVACAVLTDDKAFSAFGEMLRDGNAAHWAWFDAAVAHDAALDENLSAERRSALKQRMVSKAKQRSADLESEKGNSGIVQRVAAKYPVGCLRKLAGAYVQ